MQMFADALQEKLKGVFDSITVTVQGNRLQLSVPEGQGVSILSDEQAHAARGDEAINSASKWFNTAARGNVFPEQTTFLTGEVTLPRDVNVLYLHSDTLAGFRDTEGPVPQQRATIAKIAIGVTPAGAFHAESLYRPHLYTTLPRTDITKIDFSLRDSRGVVQDLKGSNLSFCVTFDTSHLLA